MTSVMGLWNPVWDLNQSKYEEVQDIPLMATTGPITMIITAYLFFVLKIGPKFMIKREAFKLTKTLIIYNAFQVVLSAYMVYVYFSRLYENGIAPRECHMNNPVKRTELFWGIWLYFIAKITELLDTVFFVLRKKDNQITFLHLYHHSIMAVGTWAMLKYFPSDNLYFIGFLNSLVHVFMYTYYGLAAFGPQFAKYLTWKKHITKFQLIQFVSIIIQYLYTVRVSECPMNNGVVSFIACNTAFFLLLFLNFYRQSYKKDKERKNYVVHNNKITEDEKKTS